MEAPLQPEHNFARVHPMLVSFAPIQLHTELASQMEHGVIPIVLFRAVCKHIADTLLRPTLAAMQAAILPTQVQPQLKHRIQQFVLPEQSDVLAAHNLNNATQPERNGLIFPHAHQIKHV